MRIADEVTDKMFNDQLIAKAIKASGKSQMEVIVLQLKITSLFQEAGFPIESLPTVLDHMLFVHAEYMIFKKAKKKNG